MSLKDNIEDWTPGNFGSNQINWKKLREQNAIPFRFYMRISQVRTVDTKEGGTAIIVEGDCELDETHLSSEQLTEYERISGLKRDSPVFSSFFPAGTMFINQLVEAFGKDWKEREHYELCHIAYNGKLDNPKRKGTQFHQTFITIVPEREQSSVPQEHEPEPEGDDE